MKVSIVTPEGSVFEGDKVVSITLPTETGVITIKEDHLPIMSIIVPGEVQILNEDTTDEVDIAISRGVVQLAGDNYLKVLADTAERAEDIDVDRAEQARKAAEELQNREQEESDIDMAMVASKIEKELARTNVGKKYKNVGRRSE